MLQGKTWQETRGLELYSFSDAIHVETEDGVIWIEKAEARSLYHWLGQVLGLEKPSENETPRQ